MNYEITQELAKSGHQLAVLLGTQHGQLDAASLVQRMAGQLEVLAAVLREKTKRSDALAAENVAQKNFIIKDCYVAIVEPETFYEEEVTRYVSADGYEPETPGTDAWQREQLVQAHKEGAYFVANRMLAAWDAGFIEDTAKNAADIARMILTSTEFMADAPEGDFDRAFADGVLAHIAAELRKGGAA